MDSVYVAGSLILTLLALSAPIRNFLRVAGACGFVCWPSLRVGGNAG